MADAIGHWATPEVVTCGPGGAKSEAEAAVLNEILVALHRVGVGRRDAVVAMAALAGDLPDAELGVGDPLDQWRWHLRASAPVAGPGPTLSA